MRIRSSACRDAIVVLVGLLDNPIDTVQDVLAEIYARQVVPKLPQNSRL